MSCSASSASFNSTTLLDIDVNELRVRFRALRRKRSLSQSEVARLLKVSQATVSSFEQGRHGNIRAETLLGINAIVSFWSREEDKGGASSRGVVLTAGVSARAEGGCPQCGSQIPELQTPARHCLSCGMHLGSSCACGHRSLDPAASYCSRCGKALDKALPNELKSPQMSPDQTLLNCMRKLVEHHEIVGQAIRELQAFGSGTGKQEPEE